MRDLPAIVVVRFVHSLRTRTHTHTHTLPNIHIRETAPIHKTTTATPTTTTTIRANNTHGARIVRTTIRDFTYINPQAQAAAAAHTHKHKHPNTPPSHTTRGPRTRLRKVKTHERVAHARTQQSQPDDDQHIRSARTCATADRQRRGAVKIECPKCENAPGSEQTQQQQQ